MVRQLRRQPNKARRLVDKQKKAECTGNQTDQRPPSYLVYDGDKATNDDQKNIVSSSKAMTKTNTKTVATMTKTKTMPSSLIRITTLFHLLVVSGVLLSLATITLNMKLLETSKTTSTKNKNKNHHHHLPTLKLWKKHSVLQKLASEETAEAETETTETTRKTNSQSTIRGGGGGGNDGDRGRSDRDRTTTRIQQPGSSTSSSISSSNRRRDEVDDEAAATAATATATATNNRLDMITPTECHDVRRYVENQQWEDPNNNDITTTTTNNNNNNNHNRVLLARNVITDPQFAISVHNREYDRVRYSSIYIKGDYYEKKVRNRFLFILNEDEKGIEETEEKQINNNDNNTLIHRGRRKIRSRTKPFVIDVGGNIGYYTLLSASLNHHVITFEINPANLIRLCESIQLNLDPNDEDSIQVDNVKPLLHQADRKRQEVEEEGREVNGRRLLSTYPFSKDSVEIYRYAVSNQSGQSLEVDIPKRNPGEAHVVVDNRDSGADSEPDADNNTIDTPPTLNVQASQDNHDPLTPRSASTTTTKTVPVHQDLATLRHAQVMTITLDMFATQQGWLLLENDNDNEINNNGNDSSSSSSNENYELSSSSSTLTKRLTPPPPRQLPPPRSPPSISILKIDTEGHEPQIIEGSKRLLQSGLVKNVLMEYRPATCRSAVIDILLAAGYGIVYENVDRQILTLLGRDASETYLDPYRPGAAAHANDPRKGSSSSSSSSKTAAATTTSSSSSETTSTNTTTAAAGGGGGGGTAKKSLLDDGYEDLWFRLLSNPLPPSAARKYWSLQ